MKTGTPRLVKMRWLAITVVVLLAAGCSQAASNVPTSIVMTSISPSSSAAPPPPAGFRATAGVVMGTGSYPGYELVVPDGWAAGGGNFIVKYTFEHPPVLGLSVWDVARVFRDPCHWVGQDFDPGPTVEDLVAALVAQPTRNATQPTDVTLASYAGKYLEWSVPADLESSTWTDFDACDVDPSDVAHRNFNSWLGNGMGNRYQQVPGQVDRLWVLDVEGQRLVIDATYSADTDEADRDELDTVVASLRFIAR